MSRRAKLALVTGLALIGLSPIVASAAERSEEAELASYVSPDEQAEDGLGVDIELSSSHVVGVRNRSGVSEVVVFDRHSHSSVVPEIPGAARIRAIRLDDAHLAVLRVDGSLYVLTYIDNAWLVTHSFAHPAGISAIDVSDGRIVAAGISDHARVGFVATLEANGDLQTELDFSELIEGSPRVAMDESLLAVQTARNPAPDAPDVVLIERSVDGTWSETGHILEPTTSFDSIDVTRGMSAGSAHLVAGDGFGSQIYSRGVDGDWFPSSDLVAPNRLVGYGTEVTINAHLAVVNTSRGGLGDHPILLKLTPSGLWVETGDLVVAGRYGPRSTAVHGTEVAVGATNVRSESGLYRSGALFVFSGLPSRAPTCRGHTATIIGSPFDDRIVGSPAPDVIIAGPGNDVIDAAAGDDIVCAGSGDDLVRGSAGTDEIDGGRGDDRLIGGPNGDVLRGGPGVDWCRGSAGLDTYIRCEVRLF